MTAWRKQRLRVLDAEMAYVEQGTGAPFLFLHGNPTSSWLWRNILPELADLGRCIAPDLVGMGDSDALGPDQTYDFATHSRYLDAFIEAAAFDAPLTLVIHDWGSALGFDWARRHPDRVRGIVYMEGIVKPLRWSDWPAESRPIFESLRGDAGEMLILEKNVFVERILPASIQRKLTADEMAEYRRPFANPGAVRRPTLDWPRQLPLDGEPSDVVERVAAYADWLSEASVTKLFINAEPGAILVGAQREFCRRWPRQSEVTVPGIHFIQEDAAPEIAAATRDWYLTLA